MKKNTTHNLTVAAMLSAVAFILMFIEFPLPMLIPSFVKMDFSDLPALLGAFALGPVYGVVISFMKNLLHIIIKGTSTACVGELCNFMLGAVFSAVAGFIYKRNKSRKTAILGAIAGAAAMAVFSVPSNYFITYPAYVQFYHMPLEAILGMYQAILPVNAEELLRLDTDLALVSYSLAASEGEMAKLDELGIPYVVIDYTTIDELRTAVKVAGDVFDKQDKAQEYLEFFDDTLTMVDERLADVDMKDAPSVYHSVNEAIRTDPEGSICGEIMEKAKVEDVSIAKGTLATGKNAYVTLEEIYNWDPDAFIANEYSVTDYILSDSKWSRLTAVKNKKVYTLPVGATRWCHPGSMEAHMGVLAVALQFYPDRFDDFDMKKYTADYYESYFGLELDDNTIDKILAGEGMRASNSPVQ